MDLFIMPFSTALECGVARTISNVALAFNLLSLYQTF